MEALLQCRVTKQTKAQFCEFARRQQLSESAALRRLVEGTLQAAGLSPADQTNELDKGPRAARLMVRLLADDRQLLQERSQRRGMPASTYLSSLARSHLRQLAPLPTSELAALRRVTNELGAIGRNLNQLARASNEGKPATPSREDLKLLVRVCDTLRTHVAELVQANLQSWQVGYDSTRR